MRREARVNRTEDGTAAAVAEARGTDDHVTQLTEIEDDDFQLRQLELLTFQYGPLQGGNQTVELVLENLESPIIFCVQAATVKDFHGYCFGTVEYEADEA